MVLSMFNDITDQIYKSYSPTYIYLFGSQAKGTATDKSDIDLCIVVDTNNKRNLITDMYCSIDSDKPFDLVLYTPDEWQQCVSDTTSFAYKIANEGVKLYG